MYKHRHDDSASPYGAQWTHYVGHAQYKIMTGSKYLPMKEGGGVESFVL